MLSGGIEMNPPQDQSDKKKIKIAVQIAELSRLLGMIPSDDTIQIKEPMTQKEMALSDWFGAIRRSFLKLSLLIGKELDIQLP
jgi:hypothetical protein